MTLMMNSPNGNKPDQIINRSIQDSAQIPPSVTRDGIQSGGFGVSFAPRGPLLPAWGTRTREYALRDLYRNDEMGLITGSFTGIAKNVASLGWEIKGDDSDDSLYGDMAASQGWRRRPRNGVEYYQEVFRQANFGAGWGTFITQWMNDYLRYDAGGYVEVIAAGDSYDKPIGGITGLAHLDALKCYPTGDPRYPAVYYDRWGGLHVMHHSRVLRMVDMDDGDENHPGYGRSALSRAVSIAIQEVWIARYITKRLDDLPPPGVTIFGGIVQQQWDAKILQYKTQQANDSKPIFGDRLNYFTPDMQYMPKIENYDFSTAPEKFDYRVYTDINVDRLANAIGVDRQELMQLMGGNIGSGSQSLILDQKSRGKCIGYFLQEAERKLNDVLPDGFTFEWKQRDSQESMENANEAKVWTGVAKEAGTALSDNEKRTLLANEVPSIRDAIMDTPRVNDVDIQPVTAEDNTAGAAPVAAQPQLAAQTQPAQPVQEPPTPQTVPVATTKKDYSTTEAGFIQDVTDLLTSASKPNTYLDRRAFGVTMRSFLRNYGLQAYKDGMAAGGTSVDTLDAEDNADYMGVFIDQSQYINGLADDVYNKQAVSPGNASSRAYMWTKSLQAFNNAGNMAANKNAMYRWEMSLFAKEHCDDCLRLNGQVHRIRNWKASGWMPKGNRLICKGFQCKCSLVRTTEKARGRF